MRHGTARVLFGGGDDISLGLRFQNDSGVQLGSIGRISVMQGNDIVYEANFNNRNRQDVILPDSARRWEVPLNRTEGLGRYTVTALFTYGSKNQSIEVTKVFWVIPMWAIIGAIGAIIIVITGVVALTVYVRKRRHTRRPRARTGLRVR